MKTTAIYSSLLLLAVTLSNSTTLLAEGSSTFNKVCSSCHTGGFKGWVTGAPNINKQSHWKEYLEKHSIEQMMDIVLQGKNDHKLKGGCSKCTDEEIINAINYIISEVN